VSLHPPELSPTKDNFTLVLDLWSNKRTGLVLDGSGTRAALVDGEPKDRVHLERLMGFIYMDDALSFKNADSPLKRPKPVLGTHLLKAAGRVARPERVRNAKGAMLIPGPNVGILTKLPVSDVLREVISGSARVPVESALSRDADLAEDIAVLLVMKVLRLAKPSKRERMPQAERNTRVDATRAALLLRRLEREWTTVQEADDYTVLGVSPDTPPADVGPAAQRMEKRYHAIAEDLSAHPKARKLAQRIYQKVAAASARMAKGTATGGGGADELPDEKTAFAEGVKQLEGGDYTRAVKWFALARKYSSNDADNVGHLGWAVYNDPERPKSKRRSKGRELLELSDFINPHAESPQFFLARVELDEGEPARAKARLERLLAIEPDYKPARKLLAKVLRG
jgi:hypothetical protein